MAEWGIDPKDFAKSPVFGKPILRGGKEIMRSNLATLKKGQECG